MNKSNYINEVQSIIKSSNNELETIEAICKLTLPSEPTPVEALIFGECKQIELVKEYLEEYNDEDLDAEDPEVVAKTIVSKIKSCISDFENNIQYRYEFRLLATYQHFLEDTMGLEYINIIRQSTSTKTIAQAVTASKEWEKDLPKTLPIFKGEKRECLLISVKPIYQVSSIKYGTLSTISDGIIEFGDERDINTRTNNGI